MSFKRVFNTRQTSQEVLVCRPLNNNRIVIYGMLFLILTFITGNFSKLIVVWRRMVGKRTTVCEINIFTVW